ncbi:MAG: hypothetical protein KGM99_09440 [Burkholderiales bacterium]|nr:hypothetical protein [Burkholderiales bacterium]
MAPVATNQMVLAGADIDADTSELTQKFSARHDGEHGTKSLTDVQYTREGDLVQVINMK